MKTTVLPKQYVSKNGYKFILKPLYCTDINFMEEDVKQFNLHTIEGRIFITQSKIVIPQIYNSHKNNGAFAETLDVLLQLSHDLQRDLWFVNFLNIDFKKHLIKKHNFKSKKYGKFDGVFYKWENLY